MEVRRSMQRPGPMSLLYPAIRSSGPVFLPGDLSLPPPLPQVPGDGLSLPLPASSAVMFFFLF